MKFDILIDDLLEKIISNNLIISIWRRDGGTYIVTLEKSRDGTIDSIGQNTT